VLPNVARLARLTGLDVEADQPLPTEFRIFAAGANESTKGTAVLDTAALAAVLAEYERGGVDLIVDLAHDSLSDEARAARNDADDARGWFKLEARNGELWAVDVTWTPDGEERLRSRRQRYISPAFTYDDLPNGTIRVASIDSCALCSKPATLGALPLVATREASFDVRREAVREALVQRLQPGPDRWVDLLEVFADRAVYEWDGLMWQIGYTFSDAGVTLDATPVLVVREYVPVQSIPAFRKGAAFRAQLEKEIAQWIRS